MTVRASSVPQSAGSFSRVEHRLPRGTPGGLSLIQDCRLLVAGGQSRLESLERLMQIGRPPPMFLRLVDRAMSRGQQNRNVGIGSTGRRAETFLERRFSLPQAITLGDPLRPAGWQLRKPPGNRSASVAWRRRRGARNHRAAKAASQRERRSASCRWSSVDVGLLQRDPPGHGGGLSLRVLRAGRRRRHWHKSGRRFRRPREPLAGKHSAASRPDRQSRPPLHRAAGWPSTYRRRIRSQPASRRRRRSSRSDQTRHGMRPKWPGPVWLAIRRAGPRLRAANRAAEAQLLTESGEFARHIRQRFPRAAPAAPRAWRRRPPAAASVCAATR